MPRRVLTSVLFSDASLKRKNLFWTKEKQNFSCKPRTHVGLDILIWVNLLWKKKSSYQNRFRQSSDDRHRDPWSVDHRRENTVVSRQHMVTCSCSPTLSLCSVVRCFKAYVLFFLKKQVHHRKNVKISANRWELKINKDCENSQSLLF
jgi:hypothetical protein